MSKDNAENNYFSTNYEKILIKRKKTKKKHLHANEFKCLEKTFTNNGV
jgi:DNA-binding winged helix-turn-helix (wHTH) protein